MATTAKFGDQVRTIRFEKSLSQQQFADAMGVSRSYLASIETGRKEPSFSFLSSLLGTFDVEPNWFFGLHSAEPGAVETAPETVAPAKNTVSRPATAAPEAAFIPIPRLDVTASAGHGSLVESEDGSGAYAFSRKWLARRGLNPDRLAVIAVSGDSMEPDLHDGDLILVNRADTTLRDGRLYVVQYSGALFVKSVQFFPGKRLCLNSRNPNHAPISIDQGENDQVKIIGRVVASMHEW